MSSRTLIPSALALLSSLAACQAAATNGYGDDDDNGGEGADAKSDEKDVTSSKKAGDNNTDRKDNPTQASTPPPSPSAPEKGGLPFRTPKETRNISKANEVWNGGSFDASPPTIRANDKHGGQSVTGKNCLGCHDGSQTAPRFAFGGTIAEGKKWTWAGSSWLPPGPPFLGWGGWGESKASGVWGTYGWQQEGKNGWPSDRSKPASNCDVRIIGADGLVFDTITDQDGNFWYKTKTDLKQPGYTGVRAAGGFQRALKSNGTACATCHETNKDEPGRIWIWPSKEPEPSSSSSSSSSSSGGFPFPPFPF